MTDGESCACDWRPTARRCCMRSTAALGANPAMLGMRPDRCRPPRRQAYSQGGAGVAKSVPRANLDMRSLGPGPAHPTPVPSRFAPAESGLSALSDVTNAATPRLDERMSRSTTPNALVAPCRVGRKRREELIQAWPRQALQSWCRRSSKANAPAAWAYAEDGSKPSTTPSGMRSSDPRRSMRAATAPSKGLVARPHAADMVRRQVGPDHAVVRHHRRASIDTRRRLRNGIDHVARSRQLPNAARRPSMIL